MKQENSIPKDYGLLVERVTNLPHKILLYHESHCLPQIVLNYLAHKDCFNLKHAAYFIDNPDFDHFIGVAGVSQEENKFKFLSELWAEPFSFDKKIKDLKFNSKVRGCCQTSFSRQNILHLENSDQIYEVGTQLGMKNPQYFTWNIKHGNHGLLIFDCDREIPQKSKRLLRDAASFLGFCSY